MRSGGYRSFIENNIPKNYQSVAKSWDTMKGLDTSAKQGGYVDGMYICMLDAMRIYRHDNTGERLRQDTDERKTFLGLEVPSVVDALLSQRTKKSLAQACELSDQFSNLFEHSFENFDKCITIRTECAREALEQKEFVASLWQSRFAAINAAEYVSMDGCGERPDVVVLRDDAVRVLISLAGAAKDHRSDISSDAVNAARACTTFGSELYHKTLNPFDRTPESDRRVRGAQILVADHKL